jgi:death-on-curing protein
VIYLTAEQVLFLHDRLVEETGGEHGVRDLGGLESALARPKAGFGGTEFYPALMTKAAVVMDGIIRNHPFIDGNKRVGIATAALFLEVNGYRLTVTNVELEQFTLRVTIAKPDIEEIAEWFRTNTTRVRMR